MIAGFILAFPVAGIVWYAVNQYGVDISYAQTVVATLIAKVSAMYLKNDVNVELNVVKAKEEAEE